MTPLHFSQQIDWSQPWLQPLRNLGEGLAQAALARQNLPAALNACGLAAVQFVPQAELPEGVAYEAHIHQTARVPTREGLHDFFNALCWMRYPHTKRVLNRLQAQAIQQARGVQATRGPLRDALTLFDENAVLLHLPEPLWQALLARDWHTLFVAQRALWGTARCELFGHALVEQLVRPFKAITGHVLCLPMPAEGPWDAWLAQHLTPEWLASKPFAPMPVLGVPGWCPANQQPGYYDDSAVFRPPNPQKNPVVFLEKHFAATI
ncbi:MAG: hypothetical protein RL323_1841 [Pseudomonadota bacterium]